MCKKYKIIALIFSSVFSGLFITACAQPQRVMSDQEAAQIIQYKYVKNPTFSIAIRDKGDYYIVGSIADGEYNEPRLLVLKQVADLWQEQPQSVQIDCGSLECPDAKKVKIGDSYYVYFVTECYGTASGSVGFYLFSPSEMHLYSMSVYGGNGNISELDSVSDDVKNNKNVYDYLTQQIAESPKIAHTSEQNLDINSPNNAVRKWQLDNEGVRTSVNKYATTPVKFTYYTQNLLDSLYGTDFVATIENAHYKFVSFYKGVVIGLDKTATKYFVAWVPSDMYEWADSLAFVDSNTIHINSRDSGPSLIIHLDSNTITSQIVKP
jgi:hypothetical protein